MSGLFNIFSTREVALFIWFLILLFFGCRSKDIRQSIKEVIKAFFVKQIILAFSSQLLYVLVIVFLLSQIGLWDMSLLKDTFLWILFSGIILFINIRKAENINYFSKVIKDNIKFVIIWEYLFIFYTFSLIWELVLMPIIFLISIMQVFIDNSPKEDREYDKVISLFNTILGLIGLCAISYVTYKTVTEFECLYTFANLKSFLLPILLTILTLPYFYGLALYMNYVSFIVSVKHCHKNENPSVIRGIIKATYKYANINLKTLKRIWKYQVSYNTSNETPDEFIKKAARKPKYIISNRTKLRMFNDIQKVITNLSNIGIGELSEWHKSYAGDDSYLSMTNYYQFGTDEITIIPNFLAIYLTGEETFIKQISLVLDIGYQQNKHEALMKFIEILELLFSNLSIIMPENLSESILANNKYHKQYDSHLVSLEYEKFERVEKFKLTITAAILS